MVTIKEKFVEAFLNAIAEKKHEKINMIQRTVSNIGGVEVCLPNTGVKPKTLMSPKIEKAKTASDEDLDRFLKLRFWLSVNSMIYETQIHT